jgi:hypothetical protein
MPVLDMTGQKFGRLLVVARCDNSPEGKARWICHCDCGEKTKTSGGNLRNGHSKSCGCLKKQTTREKFRTHGASETREHAIWLTMINRCHLPTSTSFYKYGARGITVCERWRTSFENFIADMGWRPTNDHSIDRIDNNGDYEPRNCRWATRLEQANNTRMTRHVKFRGVEMPLMDALRLSRSNVHPRTAFARIEAGWDIDLALTKPAHRKKTSDIDEHDAYAAERRLYEGRSDA